MTKPLVVLGAGGHARVIIGELLAQNREIIAIVAPDGNSASEFKGIEHFESDHDVLKFMPEDIELVNAVGSLPRANVLRQRLYSRFSGIGYHFATVVARSATISPFAQFGEGVQVFPGAIVNACNIGANTIVNSGAVVEHDVRIGNDCHIAPGAILCGAVQLADGVHIGAGATVIQNISIGKGSIVGAGSVVTRNLSCKAIQYPAKPYIKKDTSEQ